MRDTADLDTPNRAHTRPGAGQRLGDAGKRLAGRARPCVGHFVILSGALYPSAPNPLVLERE